MSLKFVITGGAGFIGSAVIRHILNNTEHSIVNIDNLTYAGNLESLKSVENDSRYIFHKVDICNQEEIEHIFNKHQPDIVMHLAAESHVDRSIENPSQFIQTNVIGTYVLLEEAKKYMSNLQGNKKMQFRFHHISTDEVYGDIKNTNDLFSENSPYKPSSPYSASKASSDHFVRAWHRTYHLPILITNCSNNYGPYQFPEKLIPVTILNALEGKDIPIYGSGTQIRDWLYVEDHAEALVLVALNGTIGQTYNIGGHNEMQNIEVVKTICSILDNLAPSKHNGIKKYKQLITNVNDRVGHDIRYAIDASKIGKELKWTPRETFSTGIRKTVEWYLGNLDWCNSVQDKLLKSEKLGAIKI